MMNGGEPLLPGTGNDHQLQLIFEVFGTPTEQTWPEMTSLPEYKA